MKETKFHSLTVTLTIVFLVLSIMVLLTASSLQIYFNYKIQRDIIIKQQQLIAEKAVNTVKSFINEKSNILKTVASISNTATFSYKEQKLILEKLLGSEPVFRQLILLDSKKQEIVRKSRLSNLLSLQSTNEEIDKFSGINPRNLYISSVYIDEITSEPMIIIASPIIDVLENFKGTLLAEVNLKFMWDMIDSLKFGTNGQTYVIDKSGNLIAYGDISRVLKRENLIHLKNIAEFVNNSNSFEQNTNVSRGILNTYSVSCIMPLGFPEWAVVVELPVEEAYKPVIISLHLTGWTMLLSFVLALSTGIYLAHRITRPVKNLRNAANKIGKGSLDSKIEVESSDEIGQLAVSFNQMVEDLKKTTTSIDNLNREVMERKKAEEEMQRLNAELESSMAKLEEANQEMKNFVYIASHDLREPLRKITSFGSILEKSLKDKLSGEDTENLTFMIDGATRMNKMIEGLLVYARVSSKTQPPQMVDLNEIITQLQQLELSVVLQEKNAIIEIPKPLPTIEADSVQIRQLLQNLIANGIKYQPKDRIPKITITSKPDANGIVRVEITDNGIGIKAEYLSSIFVMFKRLNITNMELGTGIGLSVCKKIVERHGGKIGVESHPDVGSTFWFTVQIAEKQLANVVMEPSEICDGLD